MILLQNKEMKKNSAYDAKNAQIWNFVARLHPDSLGKLTLLRRPPSCIIGKNGGREKKEGKDPKNN